MARAAGFVAQSKSRIQNQNEDLPRRQSGVEQQATTTMYNVESLSKMMALSPGRGQVGGTTEAIAMTIDSGSRAHYRIVYEETGFSIAEAETLDAALFGLQGALRRIAALHEVGWLHRHISTPLRSFIPVLVDFEHAVEDNDEIVQDVRTGSCDFMASELMIDDWTLPFSVDIDNNLVMPSFRQLAFHDVESVFWIAL
uniref:Fungal-type protein kinase domain-containing protein n=1 Tax=Moniliophthora roreri TaxID=221103 RepID=A0A0W0F309_MONRR